MSPARCASSMAAHAWMIIGNARSTVNGPSRFTVWLRFTFKLAIAPALFDRVRRDVDLCGEFELLSDDDAPDSLYLSDSPVDTKAWSKKGAEAVLRVSAKKADEKGEKVEITGQAYLVKSGSTPVFEKKVTVLAAALRTSSHRLADALIGALTGTNGGFASRLTFASGAGKLRRVYVIDADGFGAWAVRR